MSASDDEVMVTLLTLPSKVIRKQLSNAPMSFLYPTIAVLTFIDKCIYKLISCCFNCLVRLKTQGRPPVLGFFYPVLLDRCIFEA